MKILLGLLISEEDRLPVFLRYWLAHTRTFLRRDAPRILLVLIGTFVLIRLLRLVTRKIAAFQARGITPGNRAQEVQTLTGVITNIGVSIILFVAALEILPMLGFNVGPLLASAGVAGLAIGFGAQALVHDFINGFFILLDKQYGIGDNIRIAGVKGMVEEMTLRYTALRDDDGTLHFVPNSQITIVSNTTRDWSQVKMRVAVASSEPSSRIVSLLQQIGDDIRHDPQFANDIVSDVQVSATDRAGNGATEYLIQVETKAARQDAVRQGFEQRVDESFASNRIQTVAPGAVRQLGSR
jgi:moderate conductance mechanosensitive channel